MKKFNTKRTIVLILSFFYILSSWATVKYFDVTNNTWHNERNKNRDNAYSDVSQYLERNFWDTVVLYNFEKGVDYNFTVADHNGNTENILIVEHKKDNFKYGDVPKLKALGNKISISISNNAEENLSISFRLYNQGVSYRKFLLSKEHVQRSQ
ncbi:MAG: hypothetical protein HRT87_06265 [Legionellales bacterium]|nr:hypothetical protein [Legionellales bacterium]